MEDSSIITTLSRTFLINKTETGQLQSSLANITMVISNGLPSSTRPETMLEILMLSIFPPIFLLIGLPGNLVSMVIWLRRVPATPGSTSLFLGVMCLTDTYVLIQCGLRQWIRGLSHLQIDLRFLLGCKLPLWLFTFASDLSTWIIIVLCVERAICAWAPIRSRQLCRLCNGAIALTVVVLLLLGVNMHFLWTAQRGQGNTCQENERFSEFHAYWRYIDMAIYSLIPLVWILFANASIICRLRRTQRLVRCRIQSVPTGVVKATGVGGGGANNFSSLGSPTSSAVLMQSESSRAREARSTRILRTVICMAISHFVFTTPIVIFYLVNDSVCLTAGQAWLSQCDAVEAFCILLQITNHLTHFFIYSFTSSIFIADLRLMCPWFACLASKSGQSGHSYSAITQTVGSKAKLCVNKLETSTNADLAYRPNNVLNIPQEKPSLQADGTSGQSVYATDKVPTAVTVTFSTEPNLQKKTSEIDNTKLVVGKGRRRRFQQIRHLHGWYSGLVADSSRADRTIACSNCCPGRRRDDLVSDGVGTVGSSFMASKHTNDDNDLSPHGSRVTETTSEIHAPLVSEDIHRRLPNLPDLDLMSRPLIQSTV
ncbi:unnamed protein product [Protopolystoma xenopodis]|uniref:G-protein coupled receptors family 1 profile domain-containing protein n=1 Tax=Protopolystoma xenopodis TaxID=117903 RepID=A0A3S5C3Y2_9PLAT|nr:unnamed protein product [Protopolystoma xenopodis]